jgi:hypothetical protein
MAPVFRRLTILLVVLAVMVGAVLLVEAVLSVGAPSPFAHTRQGHFMGWIGLGAMLLVFVYPVKKRVNLNQRWPRGWFQIHMIAGIVAPLLIVLHSGAHLHALVPILALATMMVVVISGIVGQGVHYLALRMLNDQRRQLHAEGVALDEIELRLHRIAAQEEAFRLWQSIHAPMTLMFLVLTMMHVIGALFFGGL